MDRLTVKFDDNSQIVIKTKRNTAINYWEVDYAHKVHHVQAAFIDTYPLKNHSRQWLVGDPLSEVGEEKPL